MRRLGFVYYPMGVARDKWQPIGEGAEYQLNSTTALGVNYVHNKLTRAIEDVGSLDAGGNEIYFAANPGEGVAARRILRTGLTAEYATQSGRQSGDALRGVRDR